MKKVYFLLLAVLFAATITKAQVANYTFAASSGTYTSLVAPTNVYTGVWDDNTAVSVPIGFSFVFNGVSYSSVFVHPNGYLTFGTSTSGYTPISGGSAVTGVVSAWGRDLQSQNTAPLGSVDYLSSGAVFTVQWSNARRYNSTTLNAERFEMQIQLNQTTNTIKLVYGTWSDAVNAATTNVGEVGLRGTSGTDFKNLSVLTGGNWASPAAGGVNTATCFYNESSVATKPASGQTYTFTPPPPCVAPAGQATALSLTAISNSQINGTFIATTADGYLVVRYPAGSATTAPVNGTAYTTGNTLGLGRVVSASALTTFSATGLTPSTNYDFYVYSYNNLVCAGAPAYNLGSPTTGSQTTLACVGLAAGTYTVGPTGTYASLNAVATALAGGTTGPVIFELQNTYVSSVETFPITFPSAVCPLVGGVTIRPQTGATALSVTSANATGTLLFDGANNITFDGRAGGVGVSQLSIINTTTTGYAIQLINSARFNTIRYCTVAGVNTGTTSGVIVFNNAVGLSTGNSNNTIDNCDIRDGATTPTNLIYCSGNTADYTSGNNNNTISNSTLHDWFNATSTTSGGGINIVGGASDWTITGNSFYQSVSRTFTMTTATNQGAILILATTFGENFTISNNFFGGSAPLCGGAAWTYLGTGTTGTPSLTMLRFASAIGAYSNFSGNTFANIAITTASTSAFQGLIAHLNGNINISGNTIGSQTTTGNITYTNSSTSIAPVFMPIAVGTSTLQETINVTNNNIGSITTNTTSTGAVIFRLLYGQAPAGSLQNFNNNIVGGTIANSIQQLTNSALIGIHILNPSFGNLITNNTVRNLTLNNTAVTGTVRGIDIQASGGATTITGNSISNLTTNSVNIAQNNLSSLSGLILIAQGAGPSNVSGNTIFNLTNTNATVAGNIYGMYFATAPAPLAKSIISRNFIHSINLASATGLMTGLAIPNNGLANVYNNMIRLGYDASGASITTPLQINGITKSGSTTSGNSFYFNTVYIGGTGVASGAINSFAFRRTTSGTAVDTVMNNIFFNARSNASGTGKHYAIGLNAATIMYSNHNDLFVNGTGGVLGINVATDYTTLAAWRTATNQDWNSVSGDPVLVNPTGTSATVDLHIVAGPTIIEQAGYNLSNVTDDYDAQARAGLTPVDIGADAGNFTVSDIAAPVIYLTPLSNTTCSTGDRAVSGINITDATGVPTSGVLVPRIYYRKGAGTWFSQPGTLASGTAINGIWNFNIVAADMGGLAPADVVSYYIIAQDIVGTPNIASNFGGAIATDVNTVTTQPTTPYSFSINGTSLSGTYTVGAGGAYTTLTAAVAAYNTACLTGPVVFSLTDAAYAAETFPITINANSFASSTNTLTIKATQAATTITGTSSTGLIVLNGADWVTINGSISATANTVCPALAATRNLTLTNTNVAATSAVIWLQSTAAFDGATNNNIININLVGSGNTQTFAGVGSGSTTISTASLGSLNNNNSYVNNNISRTQYGIFSQGNSISGKNTGTVINQNLVNTVAPNNTARGGILVGFENGITISGNNISEISLASTPDVFGIALGGISITTTGFIGNEVTNATVTKNIIGSVRNTGNSFSACGIFLATALSGTNLLANNTISGVSGNPTPGDFSVGMLLGGGSGSVTQVYYNTITMTNVNPLTSGTSPSYALAVGGTTTNPIVDIRNNILVNTQNNGTGNNYAIGYGYTPFTNLTSNNNDYYTATGATFFIGATGSLSAPANQLTVANLQAVTTKDGNAKNVLPVFISATDLHLSNTAGANWCLNGTGQTLAVTDDMDCQVRNNPPDIGADEFVATVAEIATPASQTVCTATPITSIVLSGSATSYTWTRDNTVAATGIAASGTGNISGTLTNTTASPVTVTFTITAIDANGCVAPATFTATVTVNPNNTIALTSAPGTNAQTVCINTAITNITYSTTGATGATFTGLPAGVSGAWAANVVTISGTPTTTVGSPFSYTVTLTGGCGTVTANGTITVTPNNTITLTSAPGTNAQTVCVNSPIVNITYSTTGATGATFTGLPAGVNGIWAANVVTISGTPTTTVGSPFNYTVTLTGGCGAITANGTITVTANNTITLTSAPGTNAQSVCLNSPITNITYSTTGATGATFTGLPAGVTGAWAANVVTISGTPTTTVGSPFSYIITLTGGCGIVTANGTIIVNSPATISSTQVEPTTCASSDGSITLTLSGAAGPYTFVWTGTGVNPNSQNQTGLTVGSYTVTVTSANTCVATASFGLSGPGGCSICPTIPNLTTTPSGSTCAGSNVTFTASGLTDMGSTYGIIFKYSVAALPNPYAGGTVIATVTNGALTSGNTVATANSALIPVGNYNIYSILTPTPIDPLCRPVAQTNLTIGAVPDVNQPVNQVLCNNSTTAPVNFTGSVPGTVFNWTNNTTSIGLAASGTGDIASFTATNVTTNPVLATITVTPSTVFTSGTATFNYTGSIQTWTVPAGVTSVNLNAVGAQGGSVTVTCAATGGLGARMQGDFAVTPGEVLSIMVGQQGLTNGADAGGGGGTFIVRGASTPLLVAGGGGGASNDISNCGGGANRNGVNASITASGTASANGLVAGGTAGNGGGASGGSGGGGGGFLTDGTAGTGLPGNNGKSYLNGGAGGNGNNNDFGGYGGGGAGWFTGGNGGGGGGYSGGGTSGNQPFSGGGGGGSFNAGNNQVNTAASGTGNGQAVITYLSGANCTGTPVTFTITVNPTPAATINYAGSPYCSNAGTASVTRTGTAGGTYSATPAGLTLNVANGDVTLGTSTAGTYTVTYTIAAAGGCAAFTTTTTITITTLPAATIAYTGSPYCQSAGTANVTRTGTAGGTYTSTAGLTINASTGAVTLGTSTPGTYTVTYTIAAGGGCAAVTATASITITATPSATISYAGTPYCSTDLTATVTRTGTAGGTYSSTAGLTINATTGTVTPNTSTPGTYTVTYSIAASGGCPAFITTTNITITQAPNAIIFYLGTPYCSNAGTATVSQFGTTGGTYSAAPAGLTINATTGAVTLGTSTPGTYTVTYTIAASGGCGITITTTTITVTPAPTATISYAGSPYCANAGTANVTRTGTAGGTYSSTAGLTINATTGAVTLGTSTPGTYTVTYTVAASGGCAGFTTTTSITITALPAATISYTGSPYCSNAGVASVTRTGTAGGTYSSTAGLVINAATGDVTLAASTAGTYTVTYTIAAGGGCPAVTATTTITITTLPAATISYAGNPFCQNAGTANVTRTGTAGGTYSAAPAGLTINAATGAVTLGTSIPGTYTVTYTIASGSGCPAVNATTSITVSSLSVAPTGITVSQPVLCGPSTVTLTVTGGSLGSGASWKWYTASCGGTLVGTGASIIILVNATTTYFVRAEGSCNTTTCASQLVTVSIQPAISIAPLYTALMPFMTTTLTATVTPADPTNTTVWFRNGNVVPGANGLTLVVGIDGLGIYTARTTTTLGCTALSNSVVVKDSASNKLFITPNPNNGLFKVRYYTSATQLGFRHVVMFATNGQKVYDQVFGMTAPFSSMDVNAKHLSKGMYVVMITDASNNKVLATGQVVIQ